MKTELLFSLFWFSRNVQNERAASTLRCCSKGLGMSPNKRIRKNCKVVPLYTACQFEIDLFLQAYSV